MLTVSGLTKAFNRGSVNEVAALSGIDLTVETAEFVTVIGSNGAGKSSLLAAVAGNFPPDRGTIAIDGRDVTAWPAHRRASLVGRVFQDPLKGTCAGLTIEENLALASRRGACRGFGPGVGSADRTRFRQLLAPLGLGLEDRLRDPVGLLSGGQRQALTLLMASLVPPRVLLLDEHTAALDPKTAGQILALTEDVVTAGRLTTLMVTHNMNQALRLGNRLIMMHQGRIILDLCGEEKAKLSVEDLLARFYALKGEELASDKMLLT